jgi:hypothetical protein
LLREGIGQGGSHKTLRCSKRPHPQPFSQGEKGVAAGQGRGKRKTPLRGFLEFYLQPPIVRFFPLRQN